MCQEEGVETGKPEHGLCQGNKEPRVLGEREIDEAKSLWEGAGHRKQVMECDAGGHPGTRRLRWLDGTQQSGGSSGLAPGQSRRKCSVPTPRLLPPPACPVPKPNHAGWKLSNAVEGMWTRATRFRHRLWPGVDVRLTNHPEDPGCLPASVPVLPHHRAKPKSQMGSRSQL